MPMHHASVASGPAPRGRTLRRLLASLAAWLAIFAGATLAPAATYTYTFGDSSTYNWSSGTAGLWNSTPVSGSTTALVFQGQLDNGVSNKSNNDLGVFTLNALAISATGSDIGSSSFEILGNPLQFVINSGTTASVITVISGSTVPAVVVSNNLFLDALLSSDVQPAVAVLTLSGTVSGTGPLLKTGAGTLVLGAGGVVNSASGDTRIQGGTLRLGTPGALAGSTLDMNAADAGALTFASGSHTYSLGGLKGSRNIAENGNTLSVGGNGQSTTYSGGITGTGGLTKTGSGSLTLTGTSGYSGPTTVTSGSLILEGRLTNSNVSVGPGALFGGGGTVGRDLVVGGTLAPGSTPGGTGPLSVSGSVTLGAGATTLLDISSTTAFDEIVGSGSSFTNGGALVLSLSSSGTFANGTVLSLIHGFAAPHQGSFSSVSLLATGTYSGIDGTSFSNATVYGPDIWASAWVNSDPSGHNGQRFLFDQRTGDFIVVPEPTTWALAAIAAGTVVLARLRRRRSRPPS